MVVSNIFYFHPYLGKISNLTNIFQMGWNHQPVSECIYLPTTRLPGPLRLQEPNRPCRKENLQWIEADVAAEFRDKIEQWKKP